MTNLKQEIGRKERRFEIYFENEDGVSMQIA